MAGDAEHGPVRVTETHSAVVLLCGDRAYKWKKPVAFDFLDFSTYEQRAAACRRELELNRRLAPDVYLDVATFAGSDDAPVEDVLVMRRLPDDRRLAHLVEAGADVEGCLRRVAEAVTGKSTVAGGLAEARGWTLLSSDEVRKELLGLERGERAPEEAYTTDARTRVYDELLARARALMRQGEPVVLDASWTEPAWREAAADAARQASAALVAFRCETPLAVAHDRVSRRAEKAGEPSDATPEVLDRLAETAVPWPEAVRVDATGEPDAVVSRAADLLRAQLTTR